MIFTTYAERVGERRGVRKGIRKGMLKSQKESVLLLLKLRFKRVPQRITDKVSKLTKPALVNELFETAFRCESLKEFESHLPAK